MTQRELLQGSREQQIEKIVDTVELITPELLEDTTNPERLNIREVVRAVISRVTISKAENKALTLAYDIYNKQRYLFEGDIKIKGNGDVYYGYSVSIEDRELPFYGGEELHPKFAELTKKHGDLHKDQYVRIEQGILSKFPKLKGKQFISK